MSNIGLEIALRDAGIEMVRCPVGDKYVMEEMLQRDLSLGGEQSGHIIFSDYLFTGDGLAHRAQRAADDGARPAASWPTWRRELTTYPQVLVNVRVREKVDLHDGPGGRGGDGARRARLAGHGRLLVRYSGTEPLLRIMLEGQDQRRDPRVGARRSPTR